MSVNFTYIGVAVDLLLLLLLYCPIVLRYKYITLVWHYTAPEEHYNDLYTAGFYEPSVGW